MKHLHIFTLIIVITSIVTGCMPRHQYHKAAPELFPIKISPIAVVVKEARPYVVSGKEEPDYVGVVHEIALDRPMYNGGGEAFSKTVANVVARALNKNGAEANIYEDVTKAKKEKRIVVLTIHEWMLEAGWGKAEVLTDLELQLFDNKGKLLERRRIKGKDPLQAGGMWIMHRYLTEKLERALNNRDIKKILG